jgi:hypothetical protein
VDWALSRTSVEKIDELKEDLAICRCDRKDALINSWHVTENIPLVESIDSKNADLFTTYDGLLSLLCSTVFRILSIVLNGTQMSKLAKLQGRSNYKRAEEGYRSLSRYLISNPLFTLQAVTSWYEKCTSLSVVSFLISGATEKLIHYLTRTVLSVEPVAFIHLIEHPLKQIEFMLKTVAQTKALPEGVTQNDLRYHTDFIGCLFKDIPVTRPLISSPTTKTEILRLYAMICSILKNWWSFQQRASWEGSDVYTNLLMAGPTGCAARIHVMLRGAGFVPPLDPVIMSYLKRGMGTSFIDTSCGLMMMTFTSFAEEKKCMNIVCENAPAKGRQKSFPLCAGCRVFPYCSTECQRSSWSTGPTPHRQVCKDLGLLHTIWKSVLHDMRVNPLTPNPNHANLFTDTENELRRRAASEGCSQERVDKVKTLLEEYMQAANAHTQDRVDQTSKVRKEEQAKEKDQARSMVMHGSNQDYRTM